MFQICHGDENQVNGRIGGAHARNNKIFTGYLEGRQSTKRWICCEDDLHAMYIAYASCSRKEILLWCDSRDDDEEIKDARLVI